MENNTKKMFKLFWVWEDDKEETWLRRQAQEGWHLVSVEPVGFYMFASGKPRDIVYRLDYVPVNKKSPDYHQLFSDAGWEYAGEYVGWQYWRKETHEGQAPEIYSDADSKVQKYRRMLGWFILIYPLLLISVINFGNIANRSENPIIDVILVLMTLVLLLFTYALIRLSLRMIHLRRHL